MNRRTDSSTPTLSPFGKIRTNIQPRFTSQVSQDKIKKRRSEAAEKLTRRLKKNVFGTYRGVGLVPRIRITPNENEKRTRVMDAGKRWGGKRIDVILKEGLDGMFQEIWLVRATNHESYSNLTVSAKANNLPELYRALAKLRADWIGQVEEESEVYDIIQRPNGVETAVTERFSGRGDILVYLFML